MLEAKCTMNYLFKVAINNQMIKTTQEADMKDLQVRIHSNIILFRAGKGVINGKVGVLMFVGRQDRFD